MWLLSRRTTRFLCQAKKPIIFSRSLPFYVPNARYCENPEGDQGDDVEAEFEKAIPKKADGLAGSKFAADTAETNADTKALLRVLMSQEKPTMDFYEKIFSTICETEEFYLVPKIFQKQLSNPSGPQPNLSHMVMVISTLAELGLKEQIDNILLSFSLYGWEISTDIYGTIIAGFLEREDLDTALHYYKLARNFGQLSYEIFELFSDTLPAFGTDEAYDIYKKEIVNFRDVKHFKLDISYYEELLGFAITLNKTEDALKIQDYLFENYLTWDEALTNGVLLLLYNSTNIFTDIADPLKKLFFRCIARNVRISDEIFNIILRYFASQNDIMSVYNTYKIADRDGYYIFPESFIPIIRAILISATPDLLKDLIKVLMYSYIKEEQRVEFIKQMVWRTVNKNDPVSYAKQLDEIYEILFNNEEYSIELRRVIVDYYLSVGDVDKAISLFLRSVDQVEIKLLNHKVFTSISNLNPLVPKTTKFYSKNPVINKFLKDNIERINLTHTPDVNFDISIVQELENTHAPKSAPKKSKPVKQVQTDDLQDSKRSGTPLKNVAGYVKSKQGMYQALSNAAPAAAAHILDDEDSDFSQNGESYLPRKRDEESELISDIDDEEPNELNGLSESEETDDSDFEEYQENDQEIADQEDGEGSEENSGEDSEVFSGEESQGYSGEDSEVFSGEDSEGDRGAELAGGEHEYSEEDFDEDGGEYTGEYLEEDSDELDYVSTTDGTDNSGSDVSSDSDLDAMFPMKELKDQDPSEQIPYLLQRREQQVTAATTVKEALKVLNQSHTSLVITPEPLSNFGQVRARFVPDEISLPPIAGEFFYFKRYSEKFNLLLPKFNITDPLKYKQAPEYKNLLSMWRTIAQYTLANFGPLRTLDLFKQIAIRAPMEFFDKQLFDSLITDLVNNHQFTAKQIVEVYNDLAQVPSYDTVKVLCDKLLQDKDFISAEDAANCFLSATSTESTLGRGLRYNIYESIIKEILNSGLLPNPASFVNSYNYFGKSLNPKYFSDAFHRFCAAGKYQEAVFIAVAAKQQRDDETFLRKILLVLPKQNETQAEIENSVQQILGSK